MHMIRSVVREARAPEDGRAQHPGILDPFLRFEEIQVQQSRPRRTHAGFEIVTYVLAGSLRHPAGELGAGGVQWVTAARGIEHTEVPGTGGALRAFRLWLNLPAVAKDGEPRSLNLAPDRIPTHTDAGARVRIVAGLFNGVPGAVHGAAAEPTYLDVSLAAGARFAHTLSTAHNGFAYVFEGAVDIGEHTVPARHVAVLGRGDRIVAHATAGGPARFLLIAAKPLCEPIAWDGTRVMSTRADLARAMGAEAM